MWACEYLHNASLGSSVRVLLAFCPERVCDVVPRMPCWACCVMLCHVWPPSALPCPLRGLPNSKGNKRLQTPTATFSPACMVHTGLCDDFLLAPCLTSLDEAPRYVSLPVGSVHPVVRRKWSWREGSLTPAEVAAEEAERSLCPTQEALIAAKYKLA